MVLENVSLELNDGERIGLIGPNGAGKSTLLHLAVGLLKPTRGEVRHRGNACRTERDFEELRREIGLMFQNPDDQLFCTTVDEDVAFGPFNLGWPRDRVEASVRRALARVGIEHLAGRIIYRLSEGEKRLVALATLLSMEPLGLLLDEPTAGLDDRARKRLTGILLDLKMPMIIASHDHNFLAQLGAREFRLCAATSH